MLPAVATAPNRTLTGILFMLAASSMFPVMNGLVQVLSARYSTEQIVWARAASHFVFVLALFVPPLGVAVVRTATPKWQIIRSMVHLMSMLFFFSGVKYLPLAKAASISFTAPFFVALLAWPMLGERITPNRLMAVIVAFLGVLIVIRPGSEVFQWASLYMLGSAACYGLYQILTRRVAGHDPAETTAVYSALVGTVVMSVVAPFAWTPIASWGDGALLFSLGIIGGHGPLLRGPRHGLRPGQHHRPVRVLAADRLGVRRLPDLGLPARRVHVDRRRHHRVRGDVHRLGETRSRPAVSVQRA